MDVVSALPHVKNMAVHNSAVVEAIQVQCRLKQEVPGRGALFACGNA